MHIRDGQVLEHKVMYNGVTYEGMHYLLGVGFNNTTPGSEAQWYLGLVDNDGFSTFLIADEYVGGGGHAGWDEYIDYDEATRPTWNENTPASGTIDSASTSTFTFNETVTMYGLLVTSDNVKANEDGFLWSTGAFDSPIPLVNNDTIKANYSITLSE